MSTYLEARNKLDDALNFIHPSSPEAKKIKSAIRELDIAELKEAEAEFVAASSGMAAAIAELKAVVAALNPNRASDALARVNGALADITPLAENASRLVKGQPAAGIDSGQGGSGVSSAGAEPSAAGETLSTSPAPAAASAPPGDQLPSGKTPDQMIDDILDREGGFVNHPADRGGPTNFGVTQATLSSWRGREASIDDVRSLTIDEARDIYRSRYYVGPQIDRLPNLIQPLVFDMSINHGPGAAIEMFQSVLNEQGIPCGVDGGIGDETIGCARTAVDRFGEELINFLVDKRIQFYHQIVENKPSQSVFLKGWLRRANEFRVA
ncbi:Lysozyme (N-acetylmuramidase) family, (EC [Olavius algarvensis Delta 1 endosymbiont]|nr:Lysozyme (N-acetylmuramidase) family, (EC [Olavius algarvensis Delta 1 endosymbiont]